MTELLDLPIDQIDPHPDNPRLQLREDVVERLVAEIGASSFGREHAILVRPHAGRYQLVSGHHRAEASRRLGLPSIPAWSREMDDDEAFMQLVLANTQGELSPLEIGMHALKAVPPAERKAGQGFKAYAERLGFSGAYIGQLHAAADVVSAAKLEFSSVGAVADKAKHLYEISKAPRELWQSLVDSLIARDWTVEKTAEHSRSVRDFDIPDRYRSWLPIATVVAEFLSNDRFDSGKVARIVRAADNVLEWIDGNADPIDAEEFTNWLNRQGRAAWDPRKIDGWLVDLIGRVRERELTPDVRTGDFRDVLADLPDDSVDLILTDPPYGDDAIPSYGYLAKFAARVLKPGGSLICYTGQSTLPAVLNELGTHLRYWWTLSLEHAHGGQQLPGKWVMVEWKPILWFVKDSRSGKVYVADRIRGSKPDKTAHEWAQGIDEVFYLIDQLTEPDALVCDPFAGSGAFGRAALERGRRFIGADLNPGSYTGQVIQ